MQRLRTLSAGIFAAALLAACASTPEPVAEPIAAEPPPTPVAKAVEPPAPDDPLRVPVRVGDSLEDVERRLLERTLAAVGGNKKKAAEILRVSLKTVYNKIKQYKLEP